MLAPRLPALGGGGDGDMPKGNSDRKRSRQYPPYTIDQKLNKATGEVIAYRERYGLHEAAVSFDGADQRAPDCVLIHSQLYEAALDALTRAREKTPAAVLTGIQTSERATIVALHEWWHDIAQRWGILSRPAMAAAFLRSTLLSDVVLAQPTAEASTNDPEARERDLYRKKNVMCDFAHLWHRWHMEVFGEHADAYTGLLQKMHLAKGSQATHATARRGDDIILRCVSDMISKTAAYIAYHRLGRVNAALQKAGLTAIKSEAALAKRITRIKQGRAK